MRPCTIPDAVCASVICLAAAAPQPPVDGRAVATVRQKLRTGTVVADFDPCFFVGAAGELGTLLLLPPLVLPLALHVVGGIH